MSGTWTRRIVLGFAVVYGALAVVTVAAWATADDPLGALPAVVLGLPWSPLVGRLTRLGETNQRWVGFVLSLPLLINLGLLGALYRRLGPGRAS